MAQLFLNNFETTFIAPVKDAPTTGTPETELDYGILRISDGAAGMLINPGSGDYYVLTAFKRSGTVESDIEIMRVTAVDNSVPGECRITVLRAQEGTTAKAYVAGDRLALRLTAGAANNWVQGSDSRLTNSRTPTGPAGGVLSGTYPNPGFAVDMATQAELDAHTGAASNAHAASAISNTPAGDISATTVQAAINELDSEKEPVIAPGTTTQYWRGDKTWRDFPEDVRKAPLTGLSTAVNTTVTAADTVLSATGKLQAQITGLASSKLDVAATSFGGNATTATKLQTARTITIGNTSKSFDGSANVSWSLDEIGVAAAPDQVSYVYDSHGRIASVGETLPTGTRTTTYTYDSNGRVTQAVQTLNGVTRTTAYTYDANGVLTGFTVTES